MEIILNSNENKINDNCLRYNFKHRIRFNNQNISLTNMIFSLRIVGSKNIALYHC